MLKIFGKAFAVITEVAICIFLISGTIFGGMAAYSASNGHGGYTFLGVLLGFLISFFFSAIFGGFIITLINIRVSIQNIEKHLFGEKSMANNINSYASNFNQSFDTTKKSEDMEKWVCSKCGTLNKSNKNESYCNNCGFK